MMAIGEWWLAVHRAVWLPVRWASGWNRPGVEVGLYGLRDSAPEEESGCLLPVPEVRSPMTARAA